MQVGVDSFRGQVIEGRFTGAEQQIGQMVNHQAVDLFRHTPVKAALAGLNVRRRNVQFACRQSRPPAWSWCRRARSPGLASL